MEIIKRSSDHTGAVADFWNAKAQDPNSRRYGSPAKTADEIASLLSQGFSLVIAVYHGVLFGYGCDPS